MRVHEYSIHEMVSKLNSLKEVFSNYEKVTTNTVNTFMCSANDCHFFSSSNIVKFIYGLLSSSTEFDVSIKT